MDFKKDFPLLNNNIVYLDNSATTLKCNDVIDSVVNYYKNYSANAHRGDYDISIKVDDKIEETRYLVKEFINAKSEKEIIFTSGTTESLNLAIKSYIKDILGDNGEVITTKAEHASLILPLFDIIEDKKRIKYADLNDDFTLSLDNIKDLVNKNTKVIAISQVTNVIGDERPIKEIIRYAHENNIVVIIDAAQSIPHMKVDVKGLDVDFLAFSSHKMIGPTGIGVLYAKEKYLKEMKPLLLGGGMNAYFDSLGDFDYKELPYKFEAGTPNIAGIIGLGASIKYINKVGFDYIRDKEISLKKYAISKLSKLNNIIIYNDKIENGILTFNVKDIFAQDVASYLNKKGICVRVGNHCAKMLSEVIGINYTIRASFYFYNTKDDIDKLVLALDNDNILKDSL